MPITEDQLSYEEMIKTINDGHTCGKCGGRLSVAWGGSHGYEGHILRCANDISHDTINRHDKEYEEKLRQIKETIHMDSKSLMNMTETQMATRIDSAKFPKDLTIEDKKMLNIVARSYGLDPLMGEIIPYQGRPYVSIDGRYRKAQETGELDGVESRPANKQERSDWDIPEGDFFFRAEVYKKGCMRPFVGWGRVRASETKPGSGKQGDTTSTYKPLQNNPQRMAEKRAEDQALRKAFHIPLPSAEDIGNAEDNQVDVSVDKATGEIIESEARIVEEPEPTIIEPLMSKATAGRMKEVMEQYGITTDTLKKYVKETYGKDKATDLTDAEAKEINVAIQEARITEPKQQEELFPDNRRVNKCL